MKAVTCPCQLTGASTRADGSLSLRFSTPELEPHEKTAFFELLNKNLTMLLQPDGTAPAELKEIKGEFDKKSPSVRLRAVLYILWKQRGNIEEFNHWYLREMERIIGEVKSKLEPEHV